MVIKVWKLCDVIPKHLLRQFLATCASSFLAMCAGLTFGISAVMLPKLKKDETFRYDRSYDSWIASVASLSMIIGSLSAGALIDKFGRKTGSIIVNTPYIVGWLFIYLADNVNYIITGRFITGLSTGATQTTALVYIGEITDPKYRSFALLFPTLMVYIGILISHVAGGSTEWRNSILVCLVPCLIIFVVNLFLKESPLWLISKGRLDEGINLFKWFRGQGDAAEKELQFAIERQKVKSKTAFKEIINTLSSKAFLKPFVILFILVVCMQCTGINFLSFYALEIFEQTFSGEADAFLTMILCDCIRTVVSITLCIFSRKIPKRITFLVSSFGLVVSLTIMIISLYCLTATKLWISMTFLILYIGFSSAVLIIGWTFLPELIPNKVRGIGSGMITALFCLILFTGVKILPTVWLTFGLSVMYSSFCVITLFCTVILCFILPETTGKTLQAIEDSFNKQKTNMETRI